MSYGITSEDREHIKLKLKNQKDFLEKYELKTMSANITPKLYISELQNRVNALTTKAMEENLIPVFITITLPSEYHLNSKKHYGYNPKDGNNRLYELWRLLISHSSLRNSKYHYVRTIEPHKDGTPHLHSLMFIEPERLERFEKAFKALMYRNTIKQYKFKDTFESEKYNNAVKSVIAYVLKYIFKTMESFKDGKIGDVGYWYIKHKIRRVTLSRSHIPLYIYRNINYLSKYRDISKTSKMYDNGQIILSGFKHQVLKMSADEYNNIIETVLWQKPNQIKKTDRIHLKYKKHRQSKENLIPLIIDDEQFLFDLDTNKYERKIIIPAYMSDYELWNYFKWLDFNLDVLDCDPLHYGITKNECIDRGFIDDFKINLNDYNDFEVN